MLIQYNVSTETDCTGSRLRRTDRRNRRARCRWTVSERTSLLSHIETPRTRTRLNASTETAHALQHATSSLSSTDALLVGGISRCCDYFSSKLGLCATAGPSRGGEGRKLFPGPATFGGLAVTQNISSTGTPKCAILKSKIEKYSSPRVRCFLRASLWLLTSLRDCALTLSCVEQAKHRS